MKQAALRVLTIVVLLLGTYRGIALLIHEPLLAMANNYDMIRVQACVDIYPARPNNVPPWTNSPEAPIKRYRFLSVSQQSFFLTSETLFAFLAKPLMWLESTLAGTETFSIRWAGTVKLTVLLALGWSFSFAWMRRQAVWTALLNALAVSGILLDPANTLYLNGFYAEFSAVIFAYAVIAGTTMALDRKEAGTLFGILLSVAVIGLCLSKIQHAAAGMALAVALMVVRLTRRSVPARLIGSLLIGALIGLAIQAVHIRSNALETMRLVSMTNALFATILPLSENPLSVTNALGLPPRCAEYPGLSWWHPPISQRAEQHPCPEAASVPYRRWFALALRDPGLMLRLFAGGLGHIRPWLGNRTPGGMIYLGLVERDVLADLPSAWFTLSRPLDKLSNWQFSLFFVASILALPLFLWLGGKESKLPGVLAMQALLAYASYISILFGNGYMDMAKVANLVMNAILSFWLIALARLSFATGSALRQKLRPIVRHDPPHTLPCRIEDFS